MLATTDIMMEPVALNMRYALGPCVAVSLGGTQMSDARLLRLTEPISFYVPHRSGLQAVICGSDQPLQLQMQMFPLDTIL
jgi:hypothetical protein